MFGLLDIALVIIICRHHSQQCGAVFWCEPPPRTGELSVGNECHVCLCGARNETGNREWVHLKPEEQRTYFWSGTLAIPAVMTVLAAIAGYPVRWHEPYWMMAVFFGALGLTTGFICSSFLWPRRGLRVWDSLQRTPDASPAHASMLH